MKKYFIPHEGNDYKPHVLRPRMIAFVCLITIIAESAFLLGATYVVPHSKLFGIVTVNALMDETNQSRTGSNLQPLKENSLLDAAAQAKANDMVANNYFAHTSPSGLDPWYWFKQAGYQYIFAGENLAVNFSDSTDVTNAWMNSADHRANILNGNFTEIGMATAQGTYEGHAAVYVVEVFGTPAGPGFPFVTSAAAAGEPVAAQQPVATSTQTSTQSTTAQQTSTKPVSKPAPVVTPKPKLQPVPVIIANSTSVNETSSQTFTAAQGAETTTSGATGTAAAPGTQTPQTVQTAQTETVTASAVVPQTNFMQRVFSDPKALANNFYLALIVIFAVALGLNIFVKFNVQHPKLIFGGILVIVIAGLFITLNQSALIHAAIL